MQRAKDNLRESSLPFHHVNAGHQTQVDRISSKCLYQLNLLANSRTLILAATPKRIYRETLFCFS